MTEPSILARRIEFSCPWLDLVAKDVRAGEREEVFYAIRTVDYTAVVAVTEDGRIPLVRQFRPAVEQYVLELPSGAVDPGEAPEDATRRELAEETGCAAGRLVALGALHTDSGRMQTRQWAFFAPGVRRGEPRPDEGEELELLFVTPPELRELVLSGELRMALHLGVLSLALLGGHLAL